MTPLTTILILTFSRSLKRKLISFPNQQFSIDGYKTYRRDRNNFGGGLLFYANENIPCIEQLNKLILILKLENGLRT